jgi:hypothetical protein
MVVPEMTASFKMLVVSILSIGVWELLKIALGRLLSVRLYRRDARDVVVHVDVKRWNAEGIAGFVGRGYVKNYPHAEDEK